MKMKTIPISIIIPVSKDVRIARCMESIDEDVEIVVILNNNPSDEVKKIVSTDRRCEICYSDDRVFNLARALNLGIKKSKNEKIIIMNSDCEFKRCSISRIYEYLGKSDIVKGRISFKHGNYSEKIVAKTRNLFSNVFDDKKNIYGPGIAFDKKIAKYIGGYFYDEDIGWAEDSNLAERIYKANLDVCFLKKIIWHAPESMKHDLVISQKIGAGARKGDVKAGETKSHGLLKYIWRFFTDRKKYLRTALKREGLIVMLYLLMWQIFFIIGYNRGKYA